MRGTPPRPRPNERISYNGGEALINMMRRLTDRPMTTSNSTATPTSAPANAPPTIRCHAALPAQRRDTRVPPPTAPERTSPVHPQLPAAANLPREHAATPTTDAM